MVSLVIQLYIDRRHIYKYNWKDESNISLAGCYCSMWIRMHWSIFRYCTAWALVPCSHLLRVIMCIIAVYSVASSVEWDQRQVQYVLHTSLIHCCRSLRLSANEGGSNHVANQESFWSICLQWWWTSGNPWTCIFCWGADSRPVSTTISILQLQPCQFGAYLMWNSR